MRYANVTASPSCGIDLHALRKACSGSVFLLTSSSFKGFGLAPRYFLSARRVLPSLSMMMVCSLSVAA